MYLREKKHHSMKKREGALEKWERAWSSDKDAAILSMKGHFHRVDGDFSGECDSSEEVVYFLLNGADKPMADEEARMQVSREESVCEYSCNNVQ